jgi:hypothetical protein
MKKSVSITAVCVVLVAICCAYVQAQGAKVGKAGKEPDRVLRHVVLFKFKDGTTAEQIKSIEDAFRALPGKIPVIHDFEWGTNNSPEKLSQGFTHCFFLTFLSEEDRNAYLPHPAHKEFGAMLGPYLDRVCVVDYWTKQ